MLPHLHLDRPKEKAVGIHTYSYALAFAAGAIIFVVVEELIPESQADKRTDVSTMGALVGFAVMMTLDVALG